MKAVLAVFLLAALVFAKTDFPFLKGASTCFCPGDGLDALQYVGANAMRLYFLWRYVQPTLKNLDASLSVDGLQKLYAQNASALDEFIASPELNWQGMDNTFHGYAGKIANLIIEVGEGTVYGLPAYNGTIADPNVIGKELYLAYQYRMTRAIVRRYNKFGVFAYQIENELNEAWLAGIQGQRRFALFGAWRDWNYVTRVLQVLNMAVKDEAPNAKTTMNFHTDIAKNFHTDLLLRGYYLDAVQDWYKYMDYISIDAYPNMYVSQPILANQIGERIVAIKKLLNNSMPVFVMETGYPMLNETTPAPSASLNFTQANGIKYITDVVKSIKDANGDGLIYFKIAKGPGFSAPPGGFTQKDIEAMDMVAKLYEESKAWIFIKWMFSAGNIEYMVTRMPTLLAGVEKGWALLHMDGTFRQGPLDALKDAFA